MNLKLKNQKLVTNLILIHNNHEYFSEDKNNID